MKLVNLPTPALVVDEPVMLKNMEIANDILKGKKAKLRPHFKSHKCAAIAHKQMEMGAVGLTCAKLGEAEDLISSGIKDVLIANEIVDPDKVTRVAILAKMCHLTICIDDINNARALSEAAVREGSTIYCYVEYDIGMGRCGVYDANEYVELVKDIIKLPNLEYMGIQAYAGHISYMLTIEERKAETYANTDKIRSLIKLLNDNGIEVKALSGGSTGTVDIKAEEGLYTELQAGSYFFMDNTYRELDIPFENSLYVLATCIHKQDTQSILDVGVKGLGVDQEAPALFTLDGKEIKGEFAVHEEHFMVVHPSVDINVNDRVLIIPGHCCSTVNLYDKLFLFKDGEVTNRIAITARGKSQ